MFFTRINLTPPAQLGRIQWREEKSKIRMKQEKNPGDGAEYTWRELRHSHVSWVWRHRLRWRRGRGQRKRGKKRFILSQKESTTWRGRENAGENVRREVKRRAWEIHTIHAHNFLLRDLCLFCLSRHSPSRNRCLCWWQFDLQSFGHIRDRLTTSGRKSGKKRSQAQQSLLFDTREVLSYQPLCFVVRTTKRLLFFFLLILFTTQTEVYARRTTSCFVFGFNACLSPQWYF